MTKVRDNALMLSVVTTAFNEADNLPLLYERICSVLDAAELRWELIVVDDHSSDETFAAVSRIAAADSRVRGIRLSRNVGSHTSILCALENARGECIVQIAADLQHPPELLPGLWEMWQGGAQVVWVARRRREGDKAAAVGFAKVYYFIMRHVVGMKDLSATGADFFAIDRKVACALLQCGERNTSLLALISWMGFRQVTTYYDRPPRLHGRSGWTLEKKLKLVVDSITSFTYLPIRLMSYVGLGVALLGFGEAALVAGRALAGHSVPGWSSLIVAVLVVGGLQMVMLGVLGEYVWRALDESRRRPRYFVEAATPAPPQEDSRRMSECKSPESAY